MTTQEEQLVSLLKTKVEETLNWGESHTWRNSYFNNLSDIIFDKTKHTISVSTLKRIWGKVSYNSEINPSTLDILAQFLDYKNWLDFVSKNGENIKELHQQPSTERHAKSRIKSMRLLIPSAFILILLTILYLTRENIFRKNYQDIPFSADTNQGLAPFSVKLHYDISEYKKDSIGILYRNKYRPLEPSTTMQTRPIEEPGMQRFFLMANHEIIKSIDVLAITNGWMGLMNDPRIYSERPIIIREDSLLRDGLLSIPQAYLKKFGTSIPEIESSRLLYVKPFLFQSDTFFFETKIKNGNPVIADICLKTGIVILFENHDIEINLARQVCQSGLNLYIGDNHIAGLNKDLSMFGIDLNEWQKIGIHCMEKNVTVLVNDKPIFSAPFKNDLGKLIGFKYRFTYYRGVVDYIWLKDSRGEIVFSDDFSRN